MNHFFKSQIGDQKSAENNNFATARKGDKYEKSKINAVIGGGGAGGAGGLAAWNSN